MNYNDPKLLAERAELIRQMEAEIEQVREKYTALERELFARYDKPKAKR